MECFTERVAAQGLLLTDREECKLEPCLPCAYTGVYLQNFKPLKIFYFDLSSIPGHANKCS